MHFPVVDAVTISAECASARAETYWRKVRTARSTALRCPYWSSYFKYDLRARISFSTDRVCSSAGVVLRSYS